MICLPLPRIVASPNRKGFLNSDKAPPSLLKTIPVRNLTNRLPIKAGGSILASHRLQVSPRKSSAGGSVSIKGFFIVPFISERTEAGVPYQPIPDALITAFTLLSVSLKAFTSRPLLFVLLSTISFFLFVVQRFSATDAPAR